MNNGKNCLGETIDTNIVNIMQRIRYKKYVQAILNVSRGKYGSFIMISENSFSFTHTYAHRRIVLSIGTNYELKSADNGDCKSKSLERQNKLYCHFKCRM